MLEYLIQIASVVPLQIVVLSLLLVVVSSVIAIRLWFPIKREYTHDHSPYNKLVDELTKNQGVNIEGN